MIVTADALAIEKAASILKKGGLVAFPTETVYGLGADATNGTAVARIFEAKGRPRFNPLILHVADLDAAREFAEFSPLALEVAKAFWPGPLTLVLPLALHPKRAIHDLAVAGLDTVAIRVPSHPVALRLLQQVPVPIAAPSANRSGHVSPTSAQHVKDDLGDAVDLIVDGGSADAGIESTIIGFFPAPTLIRPGALSRAQLEGFFGRRLADMHPLAVNSIGSVNAPGQLPSHYAPRALVRLNAGSAGNDEALLGFGPAAPWDAANLSTSGDLREAAANLFAMLRELDASGAAAIAVMPIPNEGLGEAINDRLRRASAPRE